MNLRRAITAALCLVTGVLLVGSAARVLAADPVAVGPDSVRLHNVMFVHLPAATVTLLACTTVFIGSVGYLVRRSRAWDDLAGAAGYAALVACSVLLLTGMIWGKEAWGQWWTWSPRLTFSLVLWLLYAGYVAVRTLVGPSRRAQVSTVYGVVAFLDVPLVYMSVTLLPDVHPASVPVDVEVKRTLLLCTGAATMLAATFITLRVGGRLRAAPLDSPVPPHAHSPALSR